MEEMGVTAFARLTPTKPAVVDGERIVTFAALDGRTNQLARALQRRGGHRSWGPDRFRAEQPSNRVVRGGRGSSSGGCHLVVPVSWRNQHDEVAHLVEDSGSSLVFAGVGMPSRRWPGFPLCSWVTSTRRW